MHAHVRTATARPIAGACFFFLFAREHGPRNVYVRLCVGEIASSARVMVRAHAPRMWLFIFFFTEERTEVNRRCKPRAKGAFEARVASLLGSDDANDNGDIGSPLWMNTGEIMARPTFSFLFKK